MVIFLHFRLFPQGWLLHFFALDVLVVAGSSVIQQVLVEIYWFDVVLFLRLTDRKYRELLIDAGPVDPTCLEFDNASGARYLILARCTRSKSN